MKLIALCTVACVAWGLSRSPATAADARPASRPNIIILLADDLGFSDLGCYGSEIATPNLDRLAARGLRFTQFYNCGRCCPTRAALLTGLYPQQAGVGDMEPDLGRPAYQGFLNDRCVTIAEVLRAQGYRTCLAGKWNVGYERPHWPCDRGFDRSFGLLRGASDYFDPRVGPRRNASPFVLDDQPFTAFPEDFYATDAFTDRAVQCIEAAATNPAPFFLYTAYTAPHSPLQAPAEDVAKYRGQYRAGWDVLRAQRRSRLITSGLLDDATPLSPRDARVPAWEAAADQDFEDLKMAVYAAQIDRMDRGIGRIVAALEKQNLLDNTLILFLSDNGGDGGNEGATKDIPPGPKGGSHIYGRAWAQVSNTPLRGYKHEMLEGGITTPLIAHWPAVIHQAAITKAPGHVIDLMATCLDAAGATYPESFQGRAIVPTRGRSLLPFFHDRKGAGLPSTLLFWEHEGHRAVRWGRWKIVATPTGPWQLFDLAADRTEAHNLAATEPGKMLNLKALYAAWAEDCGVVPWAEVAPKK